MSLRVLIAGATGWTGAPLTEAVAAADDLELAGGIARSGGATFHSVDEAFAAAPADVFVDYTGPVDDLVEAMQAAVRHQDGNAAGQCHVAIAGEQALAGKMIDAKPSPVLPGRGPAVRPKVDPFKSYFECRSRSVRKTLFITTNLTCTGGG